MKKALLYLFFSLIVATFTMLWISEKLSVVIEKEKYSYFESFEKGDLESQTENKLKTLFINKIEFIYSNQFVISKAISNTDFYFFNIKEISLKNVTPPPEFVYVISNT